MFSFKESLKILNADPFVHTWREVDMVLQNDRFL